MASPVLDLRKKWVFHFGGLVENEIPLKLIEKNGVITFIVPLGPNRDIKIELISSRENGQIIEGKYTLTPFESKETVLFKLTEAGKLIGRPKGTLSRDVWMISPKEL
ncbi:MAG: hypothetical protein JSS60_07490 [Verrucomicrobia bacterium]|nr:hypothetical protein [Verrucomicrobiota bacterium]